MHFSKFYYCLVIFAAVFLSAGVSHACCTGCRSDDCQRTNNDITGEHNAMVEATKAEFDDDLEAYEEWLIDVMLNEQFVPAMGAMATQLSAVAMQYTMAIGMFMDAQFQMDTQRVLRKYRLEAHSDYHPSEDFCWFGSNVKSLAATDMMGRYNSLALGKLQLSRQLGVLNVAGDNDPHEDMKARWNQFITRYCDVRDNNAQTDFVPVNVIDGTGLDAACDYDGADGDPDSGAEIYKHLNRDVDFTRLIDDPRTIDFNMTNDDLETDNPVIGALDDAMEDVLDGIDDMDEVLGARYDPGEEEDVLAMAKNLYGHRVLSRDLSFTKVRSGTARKLYLALRSAVAQRGVAQASFNAIVGLKSYGSSAYQDGVLYDFRSIDGDAFDFDGTFSSGTFSGDSDFDTDAIDDVANDQLAILNQTQRYMGAVIRQLMPVADGEGLEIDLGPLTFDFSGGNILDFIGYSPSYFSQLEILAKRIYQIPTFYSNLYDTPANVARKRVAMQAIELMVDREIYESQLRREMSISVLLSSRLRSSFRLANKNVSVSEGQD